MPHLAAAIFFVVLIVLETARRSVALLRHPMSAYLARGALAAIYFALAGLEPTRWLDPDPGALLAGVALALAIALVFRRQAASVLRSPPAMLAPAAYLAMVVALVEELVFRGAFVLAASATPLASMLAIVGSSVAYVMWRTVATRERAPRALGLAFAAGVALALATVASRSLWPALLAHAAFVFVRGRP